MIDISKRLLYYKREDVREAITSSCDEKEVATKFSTYFGKRPDMIQYPGEIFDMVKKGATSFHVSEEHWFNPLDLKTGINKSQLDEFRKGWDLVLDIDCPNWEFSKLTTYLFIEALKKHDIKSISCKFSGNKGFHIGVPFNAFPKKVGNILMKDWFPEGPKRVTEYLLHYISKELITQNKNEIIFDEKIKYSIDQLSSMLDIKKNQLVFKLKCKKCGTEKKENKKTQYEYVCPKCDFRKNSDIKEKVSTCQKCNSFMQIYEHNKNKCENCKSIEFVEVNDFNPLSVVDVDTVLISSRHLYRSPYSFNEKSGLVSIVIPINSVLNFKKDSAKSENIKINPDLKFLDNSKTNASEATELFIKAIDWKPEINDTDYEKKFSKKKFDIPENAIPITLFPPCILKILEGLIDGRKRSMFILLNFLRSAGWEYDKIENIMEEWNEKNQEKLKEVLIKGHIRYHKTKKKSIPPPNCKKYYQDLGVCNPDNLRNRIKNPINYSLRKSFSGKNKNTEKLTNEQKEIKKKYRQKLKKEQKAKKKD